jgi:chromosome segregation and condensation protein ScpB
MAWLRAVHLLPGTTQSSVVATRDGLKDIFGKEISRNLIGRLHARGLIGTGPRSLRRGAPYTFVTTEQFLVAFGLETLRDLPDREQLADAGLSE